MPKCKRPLNTRRNRAKKNATTSTSRFQHFGVFFQLFSSINRVYHFAELWGCTKLKSSMRTTLPPPRPQCYTTTVAVSFAHCYLQAFVCFPDFSGPRPGLWQALCTPEPSRDRSTRLQNQGSVTSSGKIGNQTGRPERSPLSRKGKAAIEGRRLIYWSPYCVTAVEPTLSVDIIPRSSWLSWVMLQARTTPLRGFQGPIQGRWRPSGGFGDPSKAGCSHFSPTGTIFVISTSCLC